MPTYSYRCTECGNAFDIQQAFTDDALTECPSCSGRLRKVFGAIGVTFNGSGFYRTDSRAKPGASADGGSSSSTAKDSGGTKETSKGSGGKDNTKSATTPAAATS